MSINGQISWTELISNGQRGTPSANGSPKSGYASTSKGDREGKPGTGDLAVVGMST